MQRRTTSLLVSVLSLALIGMAWTAVGGGSAAFVSVGHAQESSDEGEGESASTPAPGEMSAEDVAERIQRFYKKTEDFHAEFTQVYTDVAAGEEKVNYGKVYFKKPGKMRWDYYEAEDLDDRKKTLVSDGEIFWVYELEFQQVFKRCLKSSQLPTSLKFLMGQGNLLEDFDVSFADGSSEESPKLALVPKEPTPKYKKVHFQVDPETFQVDKTTVYDPYGNTNEIDFQKTKLNKNLPDSGFSFEPPEGARLLNPQKECG